MESTSQSVQSNCFAKFVDSMAANMNRKIDPRDDFFSYACGRFREQNYDKAIGDYHPNSTVDGFKIILKNPSIDCSLIRKVRDFHNSLPNTAKALLENEGWNEICDGFPAFRSNWSGNNFNWIQVAAILSAMGLDIILSSSINYLGERKVISVLTEEPSEYWMDYAEEQLAPLELDDAKIYDIINDVNIIKEKISNITDREPSFEVRTFQQLRQEVFNYQLYYETLFGQHLHDGDIFNLDNREPAFFEQFLNIFEESPPKVVANYFTFVVACLMDESSDFYYLTTQYFAPILLSVGYQFYYTSEEINKRKEMLEYISKISEEELPIDKNQLPRTFIRDSEIAEFVALNFNYNTIEQEYASLEVSSNNFVQNTVNVTRIGAPPSLRLFLSHRREDKDLFEDSKLLLEFYVKHYNKPKFFFFSGWVAQRYRLIISSLNCGELVQRYSKVQKRIRIQIKRYNFHAEGQHIDNGYPGVVLSYLSSIEALRLAYKSFKSWLDNNQKLVKTYDAILKSKINLDCRKAFFVAYAQYFCNNLSICRPTSHIALLNSEFGKEFNCKSTSKMFLRKKCCIKWNIR